MCAVNDVPVEYIGRGGCFGEVLLLLLLLLLILLIVVQLMLPTILIMIAIVLMLLPILSPPLILPVGTTSTLAGGVALEWYASSSS